MKAIEAVRSGDVDGAVAALKDEVRADPANAKHRIFLFQLLCICGEWDKAMTQLSVIEDLDESASSMVKTYREVLSCEVLRAQVFAGGRAPLIFGKPEEWVAILVESARALGQGRLAEALDLRGRAFEAAPGTAGKLTVRDHEGDRDAVKVVDFEWIADADPRCGPTIEAIIDGKYYWVPFTNVKALQVEPPTDLRDFVWTPAYFTWTNGGQSPAFIPTRYPGSEDARDGATDDTLRLARRTDWVAHEADADTFSGLGQRMLSTDVDEFSLLDVRKIELDNPYVEPAPLPADAE